MMKWRIHHDSDSRLRLRKMVVELYNGVCLIDRTRMFTLFHFRMAQRLKRRQAKMLRRAAIMMAAQNP